MDIYSKIDKMFQKDITQEVLDELKELKYYVKRGVKVVKADIEEDVESDIKADVKVNSNIKADVEVNGINGVDEVDKLNKAEEAQKYKQPISNTSQKSQNISKPQKIISKSQSQNKNKKANLSKEFINFMKNFKQKYRAKKRYNFYIEFEYKGKILSLNEKGLICDERGVLPTYKALEVFEYLYKNRLNIVEEKEEIF